MVSNTLRSTIPKAIVYCQVKESKQNLLDYFYTQIGRREIIHQDQVHGRISDLCHCKVLMRVSWILNYSFFAIATQEDLGHLKC